MKYLKYFESELKYEIGDYILLNLDKIYSNNERDYNIEEEDQPDDSMAKIIGVDEDDDKFKFGIIFYTDREYRIREDEIERRLTPEEIEEFETKKSALKYNL